ncbi:MAG: EAL domain-containing protein [Geodermatophilaceae bacterium]|nr:EAL domain-containing protein [Geodermatophilaceae bacterium]
MSAADGRCTAVAALVRCQHPVRGLLPPREFIQAAETTGAIVDIGAFVLRRACADAADWPESDGAWPAVHVNVSPAQLTDPDFVGVRGCLEQFAMGPKQLVLEITESMVLDSPVVRATLDALVAIGVAIAIDDFGTGYSALTILRTLPLDIVKIDRSFVSGCSTSTADHAVVEAIVQMASRLGLQTVAEGVERLEQQDFLRAVGADAVQGFLHQRPVPAAEIARWLRAQPTSRPGIPRPIIPLITRRAGRTEGPVVPGRELRLVVRYRRVSGLTPQHSATGSWRGSSKPRVG